MISYDPTGLYKKSLILIHITLITRSLNQASITLHYITLLIRLHRAIPLSLAAFMKLLPE